MKLRINLAILGLLIISLSASGELTQRKLEETVFNNLEKILKLIPDPTGKILTTLSSTFFSFYITYQDAKNITTPAPVKNDLLDQKKQMERFDEMERLIIQQAEKIINRVTSEFIGENVVKDLQHHIDFFKSHFDDRLTRCLLRPSCETTFERYEREELLDRNKPYRKDLKELVTSITVRKAETQAIKKLSTVYDYIVDTYKTKKSASEDCSNGESEHDKIYSLSTVLMALMTKSYSLIIAVHLRAHQSAVEQNNTKAGQDYLVGAADRLTEYQNAINALVTATHRAFNETSREIRPCDPPEHIRNTTYERLTKLVIAEKVIFRRGGIKVFDHIIPESNHAIINLGNKKEITPLKMQCQTLKKYKVSTAFRNLTETERKFHHFSFEDTTWVPFSDKLVTKEIYGKDCTNETERKLLPRYYDNPNNDNDGSMCLVDQEDQIDSVRKFSIQNVVASPGYVITGVQWLIKNKTVYLEIQEGKFIKGGIDLETVRWKTTPEDYTQTVSFNISHRSVSLNEVILPPNALLTGVQFEFVQGVIFFRAEGIETDLTGTELTGKKVNVTSIYLNAKNMVKIDDLDVSELAPHKAQHKVLRDTNDKFIPFGPTSFEKDAGQTTIPYLDIQPIVTNPSAPLGGIGMYYKGMQGYGGFVGIKILTADVAHKINPVTIGKYFDEVNSIFKKYINHDGLSDEKSRK